MAADDKPRETILRKLKYERIAPSLIYDKLYRAVVGFLTSPTLDRRVLDACRRDLEFERDACAVIQRRENLQYELNALDAFERSLNALNIRSFIFERLPQTGRPVQSEGVHISVRPTVRIRVSRPRGKDLIGALLIDHAKGIPPKTTEAELKLTNAMSHSAAILNRQVSEILAEGGRDDEKVSTEHCIIFHTYRQQQVCCPGNSKKMMNNIDAVCRNMARGWAGVEPPAGFDPSKARYRG